MYQSLFFFFWDFLDTKEGGEKKKFRRSKVQVYERRKKKVNPAEKIKFWGPFVLFVFCLSRFVIEFEFI